MRRSFFMVLAAAFILVAGCASINRSQPEKYSLVQVAQSGRQWTGITVSRDGRIFVNYPRWSPDVPFSVGELRPDGSVAPYPSMDVNKWGPGSDPGKSFVCVQSVVVDADGFLWILDPANPQFKGVVPGGPKLIKVDLATNRILDVVRFAAPVITSDSYLNDVRFDTARRTAYITDSGSGALVVVDLATGTSRRLLANDPSTHSEEMDLIMEGKKWRRPDGSIPKVHADGIALDREGKYLYYHALTGRTLYRIDTAWLRDTHIGEKELARKVERMGETGAADGMEYGADGRVYLTSLEDSAIKAVAPGEKATIVVRDAALAWPDTLAFGPDGALYVTTSQIHRGPHPPEPYKIFKVVRE